MKTFIFRVLSEADDEVFRDVELLASSSFEQLHTIIKQSYDIEGEEMASFYQSDAEWNKGQEITLFDMTEENTQEEQPLLMSDTTLEELVDENNEMRLFYVYDFLLCQTFFIELILQRETENITFQPQCVRKVGVLPPPDNMMDDLMSDINFDELLAKASEDDAPSNDPMDNTVPLEDEMFEGFNDFEQFEYE